MEPITFTCTAVLEVAPEELARRILDLANWTEFKGYGPLPGVRAAEFEIRTPEIVGSRIRVTNTDGSRHVEEILEWEPSHRLRLALCDFTPPLSRLATHFEETWEFAAGEAGTEVRRSFRLYARASLFRPFLKVIAILLKRAIDRQMRAMGGEATA